MIKLRYITLKEKYDKYHYYSRFNKKLPYLKFKTKNWNDQLNLSFKADKFYKTKLSFFKQYYKKDNIEYVEYVKKNISKKKKILSIGSGRGVSELKLHDLGYDITLSDLNYPTGLKQLNKSFKNLKYKKFNIFKKKSKNKYDVILCFNLIYAFDENTLNKFFQKCKKIINKNGIILISPGGSTLNFYKIFFDRIYLPIEIYFLYFLSFFKKKKFEIFKHHHGYMHSNQGIVKLAKKNSLILSKKITIADFISEFDRSIVIKKLISKSKFFKNIFLIFGKKIPFVKFFFFEEKK